MRLILKSIVFALFLIIGLTFLSYDSVNASTYMDIKSSISTATTAVLGVIAVYFCLNIFYIQLRKKLD